MLYKFLPNWIKTPLFGDRIVYGKTPFSCDQDWDQWISSFYYSFYKETQKKGVSNIVNHAGYKILNHLYLSDKIILEMGPGDLPHIAYWNGKPAFYYTVDIRDEFLAQSKKKLDELFIPNRTLQIQTPSIPLDDNSLDMIIGFYVLEHLNPLNDYLNEFIRLLKPGGLLVGGIPTEGGLGWGLGRYFSSRKYIKKHSKLDPDKIICWEHPNFAPEILYLLTNNLIPVKIIYWPFRLKLLDVNFIVSFIAKKSE